MKKPAQFYPQISQKKITNSHTIYSIIDIAMSNPVTIEMSDIHKTTLKSWHVETVSLYSKSNFKTD